MAKRSGRLLVNRQGDIGVVVIQEKQFLKDDVITEVGDELVGLVDQGYNKMVIDFQNVQYLSSKMLGKLMALYKRIEAEGGGLALCSVKKELREVFEVTQLDKVLNLQADQAKAVESLKKKKGGWL